LADDGRSGRQSIVTRVEVKEQLGQRIRDNRRISTYETASERASVVERSGARTADHMYSWIKCI